MINLKLNLFCPKHTSAIFFIEPKFYYNKNPKGRTILVLSTISDEYMLRPSHSSPEFKKDVSIRKVIRLQILQNEISKYLRRNYIN